MRRALPLLLLLAAAPAVAAAPAIDTPPADLAKDGAKDVALILAVEDYAALPEVEGAEANARAWQAYLKARGVGTVKLMLGGDVTKESVLGEEGAALALRGLVKPGGTVWLVFIGHGAPGAGSGALVGWDTQRTAASVTARSIDQDELLRTLGRDEGVSIVAVVDACFSGRTGDGELAPGVQPVRPVEIGEVVADRTTVLVAARSNQYAGTLPGVNRPAFSWLALGALRGWADEDGDGAVTATEVVDWSGGRLVEVVNDRRQTPEVFGDGTRVLGRGREVAPDLGGAVAAPVAEPVAVAAPVSRSPASGKVAEVASDADLVGDVDAIAAKLREAEALKGQLAAARERELAAAVGKIQAQAKDTWGKLAPLRELGGAEAEGKVKAFVARYGTIEAEYTDAEGRWTRAVTVPEVATAQAWLARGRPTTPLVAGKDWTSPTVGLLKWVPPARFLMGSPESEAGRVVFEQEQWVAITRGYLLMDHEVTQAEWEAVMGSNPSEHASCGPTCPVDSVSWLDAVSYANALSALEGLSPAYTIAGEIVTPNAGATGYRLPTEAEWEWAATGPTNDLYAGGSDVCAVGNVANESRRYEYAAMGKKLKRTTDLAACDDGAAGPAPVRSFQPNARGLYDMSGNVREWVWDWFAFAYGPSVSDPVGPTTGTLRCDRGGSWGLPPGHARTAARGSYWPSQRSDEHGLRLARSAP